MGSLVISIFLSACESLTVAAELEKRKRKQAVSKDEMLPKAIEHFVQGSYKEMGRFAERSKQPLENMMNSRRCP